jgi:hypothetical protein
MIGLVLTLSPLFAAAQLSKNETVVTEVPFTFMVGSKAIPAGKCVVRTIDDAGNILLVRNAEASVNFLSMVSAVDTPGKASHDFALVFHRYGERYFLWGMRIEGSHVVYRLPENKLEKELRAQNTPSTEETLISTLQ